MDNPYQDIFNSAGTQYGVDPYFIQAMAQQESQFNPKAISPKGAQGIMQLMPDTAKELGVKDSLDPNENIPAGAKYFAQHKKKYNDPNMGLLAYNWGEGNVDKWMQNGASVDQVPEESKEYIRKVNENYDKLKQSEEEDPFEAAKTELANKASPEVDEEDPFEAAKSELANKAHAAVSPKAGEAGPEWLKETGKIGANVADTVGQGAWQGVQELGANMTPMKMAMIAPSMAIAPVMSGLAETSAAVPYLGKAASMLAGEAPEGAGIASNLLHRAIGGAAQGGAANALMGGDFKQGAAIGGVVNPALGAAGDLARPVVNAITGAGGELNPEIAKLAKIAADKHGIEIPGGLLSGNPLTKDVYSTLKRLGMTPEDNNIANFTSAASKSFGENTPKLTRETMDKAEEKIGDMFDEVWNKTPSLKISNKTLNKLSDIHDEATSLMPNDTRILKQIDKILDAAAENNGEVPSKLAKNLVSTDSTLHKLTRLGTDPAADLAFDIKNTLYDALGDSAPPDALATYQQAKKFYKNYKTVQAAKPNPVTGELSPLAVQNSVNKTAKRFGRGGLNHLQELGDIGQQFRLTPSSGTAEKLLAAKLAGSALSGLRFSGDEGIHYDPMGALYGAGAIFGGNAAGNYLSSSGYRDRLINSALQSNSMMSLLGHTPMLSNSLLTGNQMVDPTAAQASGYKQ